MKLNRRIAIFALLLVTVLATVATPFTVSARETKDEFGKEIDFSGGSGGSGGDTAIEEEAKKFLMRSSLYYSCFGAGDSNITADQIFNKTVMVGESLTSIIANSRRDSRVFVGSWISDTTDGTITCRELMEKAGFDGAITSDMVKTGGILNGIYQPSGENGTILDFKCKYKIINADGSHLLMGGDKGDGWYYWPQGFPKDNNYSYDGKTNFTNISPFSIRVGFNSDTKQPEHVTLNGGMPEMDTSYLSLQIRDFYINTIKSSDLGGNSLDTKLQTSCINILRSLPVYPVKVDGTVVTGENAEQIKTIYTNSAALEDDKKKGAAIATSKYNTGVGMYTATLKAIFEALGINTAQDVVQPEINITKNAEDVLELTSTAKQSILAYFSDNYFDQKTPQGYLNSHTELKYLIYGRYLFNADNPPGMIQGASCGIARTVAHSDPNFELLKEKNMIWMDTNTIIVDLKAYADGSASTKSDYRSMIGSDSNRQDEGEARSISFLPWEAEKQNCTLIADVFSGITTTNSDSKEQVKIYMGVQSIPEDGSAPYTQNVAPSTVEERDGTVTVNENLCTGNHPKLGWILCPIINGLQEILNNLYTTITENFLQINASMFTDYRNTQNEGVFHAWQIFQNMANVVFVILFLVTIISQITGYGIDNYGVKRLLPKLIIAAILVNLSFIICELLVDVSNISGYGIKRLFDGITVGGMSTTAGGAAFSTFVSGAGMAGAGIVAAATVEFWAPALLIPFLLGLIAALISLIFMFILLGIRQAGIIILVVVSPVAFVLYMLPNTKSIFDRWKNLFQSLLLLYPICGAMVGGCALAGRVLISSTDNFWMVLLGGLLSVIPFFLVPKLVKSSMAAVGKIGGAIANLGGTLSKGVTRGIGNSQGVKDTQARLNAGVNRNGEQTALGRYRDKIATGKSIWSKVPGVQTAARRKAAAGKAAYVKMQDEKAREEALMDPDYMARYQRQQEIKQQKENLATDMDYVLDQTNKGENIGALETMFDQAVSSGNTVRAQAIAEISGRRKDTANAFSKRFKAMSASGTFEGRENMLSAVAKQMSTGDNSKNYRAADALGFEYASQVNNGTAQGSERSNFGKWVSNSNNVHSAIDHHITNNSEIYGQSNGTLNELTGAEIRGKDGKVLYSANVSGSDRGYLSELAMKAESESASTGVYDKTKDESIKALQGLSGTKASDAQQGEEVKVDHSSEPKKGSGFSSTVATNNMAAAINRLAQDITSGNINPKETHGLNRGVNPRVSQVNPGRGANNANNPYKGSGSKAGNSRKRSGGRRQ